MIDFLENIKYFLIKARKRINLLTNDLKKLDLKQYTLISIAFFSFIFILSVFFYFFDKGFTSRRVFFFPDTFSLKLRGEERFLKTEGALHDNVKKLVEELLLGPTTPDNIRVFPQGTQLVACVTKNNDLYLNLSEEVLLKADTLPFPLEKSIFSCINTLRFNFPEIKKIFFFIHGEELVLQIQDKKGNKIPIENIGFSQDMLQ
jgi:hypothetical protein